jgi:peptide/nickel transport system ATP-binding protein
MSEQSSPSERHAVLEINGLGVTYDSEKGRLETLHDVSLSIRRGEVYGLVGESGSGKTTLARAVVRFLPRNGRINSGSISLNGVALLDLSREEMRRVWGAKIAMVHQDPSAAVNPSLTVGEQVAEVARTHLGLSQRQAWNRALEMLAKVQLPEPEAMARRYPHQMSGGMLQRILIAAALVTSPQLLIMDEPTTSLDVTTEAVILDLIRDLLKDYETAVLYITHNLGVIANVCHRVGVMYAGQLVEEGSLQQVFKRSLFPYTVGLMGCVPRVDVVRRGIQLNTIAGFIPRPGEWPSGCIFAGRCPIVEEACKVARLPLMEREPGHLTACRRWTEMGRVDLGFGGEGGAGREAPPSRTTTRLQATQIKKYYGSGPSWVTRALHRRSTQVRAVDGISLRAQAGTTVGIVGESGCGKTTFARCVVGLEQPTAGEVRLDDMPLGSTWAKRSPEVLRQIQIVFQNPDASLNPFHPVGTSVSRPIMLRSRLPRGEVDLQVRALFHAVRLPEDYTSRLPHELSGGEKQRVAIARAFAASPSVVICDEPVSSLDVSVQASLMNLLADLQRTNGTSYLFISHDLAAVRHLSDRIAVIYLGTIVELGPAESVFAPPFHPYTEALFSAIPIPDPDVRRERIRLGGSVPSASSIPTGCRFHTRCPRKVGKVCEDLEPPWQDAGGDHFIQCHIPFQQLRVLQKSGVQSDPVEVRANA